MTSRAFNRDFAWQMTASQAATAAAVLAGAAARGGPVDAVVAIARGGTQPARDIAAALGVQVRTVRARHNPTDGMYAQATGRSGATRRAQGRCAAGSLSWTTSAVPGRRSPP